MIVINGGFEYVPSGDPDNNRESFFEVESEDEPDIENEINQLISLFEDDIDELKSITDYIDGGEHVEFEYINTENFDLNKSIEYSVETRFEGVFVIYFMPLYIKLRTTIDLVKKHDQMLKSYIKAKQKRSDDSFLKESLKKVVSLSSRATGLINKAELYELNHFRFKDDSEKESYYEEVARQINESKKNKKPAGIIVTRPIENADLILLMCDSGLIDEDKKYELLESATSNDPQLYSELESLGVSFEIGQD